MLAELLGTHAGEVAAIMIEPARSEMPERAYLEGVKALARENGAILIFDEVTSGWRISTGGVQEHLGVTPDMTVLAKAMSNGFPMGAVVGVRDVMEPAGRMFISSSYWSDNIGLVASLTTIRELKQRDAKSSFREIGEQLRKALNSAITNAGLKGGCVGLHTNPRIALDLPPETDERKIATLFIQEMAKRGVHCFMNFKATLAHTDTDIRYTVDAAAEALLIVKKGFDSGNFDDLLETDVRREPFRRLVR